MKTLIAITIAFLSVPALSQVDLTAVHSTYDNQRLKSDWGVQARVGRSAYLWGSYEQPALQLVGQNMGRIKMWGAGLGYRRSWDRLSLFGEFGYFDPATNPDPLIRDEAVWQQLQNDHGVPAWRPDNTVYKLGDSYGGRLGVVYEIARHMTVSVSYRFLSLDEGIDACTGADSTCEYPVDGKHWQNRKALSLNSFEFGAGVRF